MVNNFYKNIIESIRAPMLFTQNHKIKWASNRWIKSFGFTFKEIKNRTIEFLFPDQDDYAKYLFECNDKLKRNIECIFETNVINKNKEKNPFQLITDCLDPKDLSKGLIIFFAGTNVNLTSQNLRADHINIFQTIEDNYDGLIFHINVDKINRVNKAVEKFLFYELDEIIGEDLEILFQTKDAMNKFTSEIKNSFLKNNNYTGEVTLIRKDRMPVDFSIRVAPINYDDKSSYVLFLEPIHSIQQQVKNLQEEKDEIEFYTDLLFHDVRNLCQDAISQIDLSLMKMENNLGESKNRQQKSMIEILRIGELITNMDKFFKIKNRIYDLYTYDVFEAIEKATDKVRIKFDHKNIAVKHNTKHQEYLVKANELLIDVFYCIIDNAAMYDREIDVNVDIIVSDSYEYDNFVKIEILDNGPGIGDELKEFLFDRYARSKGTIHGSGFSLTLTKAIITSYNGYIRVEDRDRKNKNVGSKFIIEIPKVTNNA